MSGRRYDSQNTLFQSASKLSSLQSTGTRHGSVPLYQNIYQALNAIPLCIVLIDAAGSVVWTNKTATPRKLADAHTWNAGAGNIGENSLDWLRDSAALGDIAATLALSGIRKVAQGRSNHFQTEFACEHGEAVCWFRLEARPLDGSQGAVITMLDISAQRGVEDELRLYRERQERDTRMRIANLERRNTVFRQSYVEQLENECALRQAASVFVNSSEAVVIADDKRRIIKVNEAFSQISGFRGDEVFGQHVGMLHVDDGCHRSPENLRQSLEQTGHWQGEFRCLRKNGDTYPAWGTIDEVRDEAGQLLNYICLFSDITALKESQRKLHFLAHHDPLTGLANRLLFWARLEQSIQHARRHRKKVALLFLDIDRFKQINDSLGHPGGDRLLRVIAQRLCGQVRGEDTIARLGGDEFGVIAEEIENHQDAKAFSDKLNAIVSESLEIDGVVVKPTASIGIGIYPDDGKTPESLYQSADAWMYRAKRSRQKTTLCGLGCVSPNLSGIDRDIACRLPVSFGPSCELPRD